MVRGAQRTTLGGGMLAVGNDTPHTARTQGANPVIQHSVVLEADARPKVILAQRDRAVVEPLGVAVAPVDHTGEQNVALEAVALVVQLASALAAVKPLVPVGATEDMRRDHVAAVHTTGVEFALVLAALRVDAPGLDALLLARATRLDGRHRGHGGEEEGL